MKRPGIAGVLLAVVALTTPPLAGMAADGQPAAASEAGRLPPATVPMATGTAAPVPPAETPASGLPPAPPPIDPAWASESAVKRFETVSLISLPFTALYSMILTAGAMLVIQKGHMKMTTGYRVAALTLAVGASSWIAWKDLGLRRAAPSSTLSDI